LLGKAHTFFGEWGGKRRERGGQLFQNQRQDEGEVWNNCGGFDMEGKREKRRGVIQLMLQGFWPGGGKKGTVAGASKQLGNAGKEKGTEPSSRGRYHPYLSKGKKGKSVRSIPRGEKREKGGESCNPHHKIKKSVQQGRRKRVQVPLRRRGGGDPWASSYSKKRNL